MAGRAHKQRAAVNGWRFRYSFPTVVNEWRFLFFFSAAPPSDDRRLFIRFRTSGGSACVWERKTPRKRAGFRHPSRERASFRQSSRERANFRHIVPDDRRLFIRFRTSGGSAHVWERKTPRERAGFRHPSREHANFRHSFEAEGPDGGLVPKRRRRKYRRGRV